MAGRDEHAGSCGWRRPRPGAARPGCVPLPRAGSPPPAAQGPTLPRARALAAAAHLLQYLDGYAIAGDYCEEALAIARGAGDDYLVADLLYERAWILLRQGQHEAALPLIESGLRLAHRLREPHLTDRLLAVRSYAAYVAGDHADAAREAAGSLRLSRQAGNRQVVGAMLSNVGYFELSAGDLDAARRHLAESLDTFRALNARDGIVFGAFNLGLAEYLRGSPGAAETPSVCRITRPGHARGDEAANRLRPDGPGPGRPGGWC